MLVRPITMKPARRSRATTGASASAGAEFLQRAGAGAGHLPLDVEEILDRDGNAGIGRRRRVGLAQMIHRIRRCDRGVLVDVNKGSHALAGGIGDPCETFLDQFARGGASGVEVGGEAGECRMVRHGFLVRFLCVACHSKRPGVQKCTWLFKNVPGDLPWRGLSPMTGWHTSALARRECGHATAPLLGPLTEIGQCRIKTATSGRDARTPKENSRYGGACARKTKTHA